MLQNQKQKTSSEEEENEKYISVEKNRDKLRNKSK